MENNHKLKLTSPKVLTLGLFFLFILGGLLFVLSTQQSSQPTPTPPSPTPDTAEDELFKPSGDPNKPIEGQILINFNPSYTDAQINTFLEPYNARVKHKIEAVNLTVVEVPKGREDEIIRQIENEPIVGSVGRDDAVQILYKPNDTDYGLQWGFKNTGQAIRNVTGKVNADVGIESAWDVTRGNGVKVAILDSGINMSHPDLAAKVIAQKVFTTTTIEDNNGHGTHVAGIIGATTNNAFGVAGTCPDCKFVIGKVVSDNGVGPTSLTIEGITWAADQGAKVINLSVGTKASTISQTNITNYETAITYAMQKGAVVVAAAGNENSSEFFYPAANPNVVSVGATTNKDEKAAFSNYGSFVKVAAPGKDIYSTLPNHANSRNILNYGYSSGTSMAGPIVSGIAALVWTTQYGTSPTSVINRIYSTADKIAGTGQYWTHGRVNAAKAVGTATTSSAPTAVAPTYVCAGSSAGNVCPPTPGVTILPSSYYQIGGSPTPTNGSATPGVTTNPSTSQTGNITPTNGQPCGSTETVSIQHNKKKKYSKNKKKHQGGFFEAFIRFILQFIFLILERIGLIPPSPSPQPMPDPCLSPTPSPSVTPSISPTISASPSGSTSPSATLTP